MPHTGRKLQSGQLGVNLSNVRETSYGRMQCGRRKLFRRIFCIWPNRFKILGYLQLELQQLQTPKETTYETNKKIGHFSQFS